MIECKYGKQKRLFINHLGELIPCCYLNAEALNIAAGVDMGSQGAPPLTLFGELNKKHDNIEVCWKLCFEAGKYSLRRL